MTMSWAMWDVFSNLLIRQKACLSWAIPGDSASSAEHFLLPTLYRAVFWDALASETSWSRGTVFILRCAFSRWFSRLNTFAQRTLAWNEQRIPCNTDEWSSQAAQLVKCDSPWNANLGRCTCPAMRPGMWLRVSPASSKWLLSHALFNVAPAGWSRRLEIFCRAATNVSYDTFAAAC